MTGIDLRTTLCTPLHVLELSPRSRRLHTLRTPDTKSYRNLCVISAHLPPHLCVVPEQLIEATREREEHEAVDKEELQNVDDHAACEHALVPSGIQYAHRAKSSVARGAD